MELPYDLAIILISIFPKKMKTLIRKQYMLYVYYSIIYNSQDMEAASKTAHCKTNKLTLNAIFLVLLLFFLLKYRSLPQISSCE